MKVMTWNIMGNRGIGRRRRAAVVDVIRRAEPDVLLLQEVHGGRELPEYLTENLREIGLAHAVFGDPEPKKYGNMVLSRWSLTRMPAWETMPWPQPVLRCRVEHPDRPFDAISVHIPNGSANGWLKIETFEALAGELESLEFPFLVGGDFNEPRTVLDDGTVIPFTMKQRDDGTWHADGHLKRAHGKFPRERWVAGVRLLLGYDPVAGVRHAAREVHGPATFWATHETRSSQRFFDHILVSPEFGVEDASMVGGSRVRGVSDHAAVRARLALYW